MGTITAKQLKQNTGEIIKRVKSGERLTLTYRGKPVGVIAPSKDENSNTMEEIRPFDEAWEDIEKTLGKTKPPFKGWKEAVDWVRNRT
ncbi:MAG: type II toxin-antitoxin system prevent-host-death family antitoxin [Thermodesulfobacteriota bacterium]